MSVTLSGAQVQILVEALDEVLAKRAGDEPTAQLRDKLAAVLLLLPTERAAG